MCNKDNYMFFFKVINGALIVFGTLLMAMGFYGMAMETQGYWGKNLVPGVSNSTGFIGVGVLGLFVMVIPCIGYSGANKKQNADPEAGSGKCELLVYLLFMFFSIGMQMGFALVILNSVGMLDSVKASASNYTGANAYIKSGEKATRYFVQQGMQVGICTYNSCCDKTAQIPADQPVPCSAYQKWMDNDAWNPNPKPMTDANGKEDKTPKRRLHDHETVTPCTASEIANITDGLHTSPPPLYCRYKSLVNNTAMCKTLEQALPADACAGTFQEYVQAMYAKFASYMYPMGAFFTAIVVIEIFVFISACVILCSEFEDLSDFSSIN